MMSDYVSHADLGGTLGHGAVVPEPEVELWHAAWEPRVLALTLAMGATGTWNIDMSRSARETLPDYAQRDYYRIWLGGLTRLLDAHGLVDGDELAAGRALHAPVPLRRVLQASEVAAVLACGAPTERPATTPPRFVLGQHVRTYAGPVPHHTRLPGYAKGKRGVVQRIHGTHVFADANASGRGEQPHWLYTVAFDGAELWPGAAPGLTVSIDAWEPYLSAEDDTSTA
jgi:nitrile hydratase subunit beta